MNSNINIVGHQSVILVGKYKGYRVDVHRYLHDDYYDTTIVNSDRQLKVKDDSMMSLWQFDKRRTG